MNLDELRSVQNRERQKDSLQHLRDSFYEEVGEYVARLKAEREDAAREADDPFASPEVRRLTDEIQTAEEVAQSVYERRMGKLVKNASLAAAGYATETEGLTAEEERLFEDLVERIEDNKATVLDVLAGERPTSVAVADAGGATGDAHPTGETSTDSTDARSTDRTSDRADASESSRPVPPEQPPEGTGESAEDSISAASMMETGESAGEGSEGSPTDPEGDSTDGPPGSPESDGGSVSTGHPGEREDPVPPTGADGDQVEDGEEALGEDAGPSDAEPDNEPSGDHEPVEARTTVRITTDVGEIFGIDEREYDLAAEDVVALPEENAVPLIEGDAAEPIE